MNDPMNTEHAPPSCHADTLARILRDCLTLGPTSIDLRLDGLSVSLRVTTAEGTPAATPNLATPKLTTWHSDDFALVTWQGIRYQLTPKQAAVVRRLWQAQQDGTLDVSQGDLLRAAESDGVRLVDLFRRCTAWQNLIISVKQGHYRLSGALPEQRGAA